MYISIDCRCCEEKRGTGMCRMRQRRPEDVSVAKNFLIGLFLHPQALPSILFAFLALHFIYWAALEIPVSVLPVTYFILSNRVPNIKIYGRHLG